MKTAKTATCGGGAHQRGRARLAVRRGAFAVFFVRRVAAPRVFVFRRRDPTRPERFTTWPIRSSALRPSALAFLVTVDSVLAFFLRIVFLPTNGILEETGARLPLFRRPSPAAFSAAR